MRPITLSKRYDGNTNQPHLAERDQSDSKISSISQKLLEFLNNLFPDGLVKKKFPVMYKNPINNIINRELSNYTNLVK
jgi:hypothetical protein